VVFPVFLPVYFYRNKDSRAGFFVKDAKNGRWNKENFDLINVCRVKMSRGRNLLEKGLYPWNGNM
jgi:hypothetical protein